MSARPASRIGSSRNCRQVYRRMISTCSPRQFNKWSTTVSINPTGSNVGTVSEGGSQDISPPRWRVHRTPRPISIQPTGSPDSNIIQRMVPVDQGGAPVLRTKHPAQDQQQINFTPPPARNTRGGIITLHPFRASGSDAISTTTSKPGAPKINLTKASFYGPSRNPLELNEFLNKYVPTKTKAEDVGQWIFVTKDRQRHGLPTSSWNNKTAITTARRTLEKEYEATIQSRLKKPGSPHSMSPWDETLERVREPLKEIAETNGYTAGGWFATLSGSYADSLFRAIARNLIAGPLKSTPVTAVKVSTATVPSLSQDLHILVVIQEDVYDKKAVGQVLEMLVRSHGFLPSGAKPDLYYQIGLGHLHRSRGHASVFSPFDFFTMEEIRNMAPPNSLAKITYTSRL
ncbi:hypothetical protein TWF696_007738 [Orbilia brochopaga]|uniref:Uncharacterized protein n=1 Tax=Orbilia brochopaga TaxID=3140254 RepID=A0AAV9US80_9PEZI